MSTWWKDAVVYHIYPRSFQDANADGIGDLVGITRRLDYLEWLGVDAIWLSPVYPSPMADFGYDVSDHCDIDPMFGTLVDMEALIARAHSKDLRVIMDFVPNHTSDEHPWFQASKSSRDDPKRDWYYWKDPGPDGGPPNNWLSRFDGESAWEWDEATGQYYLHTFLKKQPDLNWRNPEVRAAMQDVLCFWFDRGVDGFRVDVSYRVMKDPDFRDNPVNPDWTPDMDPSFRVVEQHTKNVPDVHQFNRWIRSVVDEYDDRVLIGEMNLKIPELVEHYGTPEQPEFHLPFNFRLVFTPWEADNVQALVDEYEHEVPDHGWPNWVLSNHDQPRFATRAGREQARCGYLFLLTVRGTPTVYYGDEIGMENVDIPPEQVQDPWELLSPGLGLGRDPVRTPMQWDAGAHAGFCPDDVAPWLPVSPSSATRNVDVQREHDTSMLHFVRRLIQLRATHRALRRGACRTLSAPDGVLLYERAGEAHCFWIAINFRGTEKTVPLPESAVQARHVVSTYMDGGDVDNTGSIDKAFVRLRPNEGVLLRADA